MVSRKDFLKSLGLAGVTAVAAPFVMNCRSDNDEENTDVTIDNSVSTACSVTNSETEGPFPTKSPSSLVLSNIVGDRTGIPLEISLVIQNVKANCANLQGVIVDIWHCDKDGNYSEYGGTQMQTTNYTNYHFLRGRQMSDENGNVSYTSIFPGWYDGRATHIHVHVYNASGTSLLVTQVAFPEGSGSAVELINASSGYRGMSGYTYNSNDNVFSDGTANEMSVVTGSVSSGFKLTHTIKVNA
jgi:protocatechuate 3,4-dioxygenase beta subunit